MPEIKNASFNFLKNQKKINNNNNNLSIHFSLIFTQHILL